jgi:protein phosphatase
VIRLHALSDIGSVRQENQDSYLLHDPASAEECQRRGVLLAVADGMGGLEQGHKASQLAIENLRTSYTTSSASLEAPQALLSAVQEANRAIYEYGRDHEEVRSMGSTLTALVLLNGRAHVAHVGDSRAYLYRKGSLRQITRDHSLVRELADQGHIDPESALYSYHRNVLTRGLGLRDQVEVDLYSVDDLSDGDLFLLTSDGLHEIAGERDIAASVERYGDKIEELCAHLVTLANQRGGPDNITVAVAVVGTLPAAASASAEAADTQTLPTAVDDGDTTETAVRREEGQGPPASAGAKSRSSLWLLTLGVAVGFAAGWGLSWVSRSPPAGQVPSSLELIDRIEARIEDRIDAARLDSSWDDVLKDVKELRRRTAGER